MDNLGQLPLPVYEVLQISPCPTLIMHGQKDEVVPVSQSEIIFGNSFEPWTLLIHDKANQSFIWHRQWLIIQILKCLDRFENYKTRN